MTAADIIAAQIDRDGWAEHEAGECGGCDASRDASAAAILAALKAAGYEVVQLPEPTRHTDNTAQWDGMYWSVIRNVGVVISDVAHLQSFGPDEACSLAAALLAAANAAEEAK
jgi:hypothetical protein